MKSEIYNTFILLVIIVTSLTACQDNKSENDKIKEVAEKFAYNYFNYQLEECKDYCTKESEKWISFVASNMDENDVRTLKDDLIITQCIINTPEIYNDTTAFVTCEIDNFYNKDFITGNTKREKLQAKLKLVKKNNKWKVRMEGLPQNEKQNHD